MDRAGKYALDAAKEITIARMSNSTLTISKDSGENVADFYEAIFNRIRNIADTTEER